MATPLSTWTSTAPMHLHLSLPDQTIPTFLSEYTPYPTLYPMVWISHYQSTQSDRLLSHFLPNIQRSQLTCGVHVSPKPIVMGEFPTLPLQLTLNFSDVSSEEEEMQRKVLFAVMSVSAVSVVCVDNSHLAEALKVIQEVRREVGRKMKVEEGSIVLVTNELVGSGEDYPVTTVLYDISENVTTCVPQLQSILTNPRLYTHYTATQTVIQSRNPREQSFKNVVDALSDLLRLAACHLTPLQFLHYAESWTSPEFHSILTQLQHSGDLIFPSPLRPLLSPQTALNEETSKMLMTAYEPTAPIIVLTVLGPSRLGTSKLLNSIIGSILSFDLSDVYTPSEEPGNLSVLLHPLSLGNYQTLLIDGSSVCDLYVTEESRVAGNDLGLSTAVVLASVLFIVVDETEESRKLVELIVDKVAYFNNVFGFFTEKIHVLEANTEGNVHMTDTINRLNRQYFSGSEVLILIKTPDFSDSKALDSTFTADLLGISHYPKRNYTKSTTNLPNLLDSVRYLLTFSPFIPTLEGEFRSQIESILIGLYEELEAIYRMTQPMDEDSHLEVIFNEMYRRNISHFQSPTSHPLLNDYINAQIALKVNNYRIRLSTIENCYRYTVRMTQEKVVEMIEKVLNYRYKEAWVVNKFMDRALELKGKLEEMMEKYGSEKEKLGNALGELERIKESLKNWFIANYAATAAATMASGGLQFAAKGVSAAFTASSVGNLLSGNRTEAFEILGYGVGLTPQICSSAFPVFKMSSDGGALSKAKSLFTRSSSIDHIHTTSDFQANLNGLNVSTPMVVLLAIGGKTTNAHQVLNHLIHCTCPFTSPILTPFHSGKKSQCLFFSYYQHGSVRTGSQPCQGVIIYIQATEEPESRKAKLIETYAAVLLPRVSLVYLFLNEENRRAVRVLDNLAETFMSVPKVTAVVMGSSRTNIRSDVYHFLRTYKGVTELRMVADLTESEVLRLTLKLKNDFDQAEIRSKSDFERDISEAIAYANAIK